MRLAEAHTIILTPANTDAGRLYNTIAHLTIALHHATTARAHRALLVAVRHALHLAESQLRAVESSKNGG